MASLAQLLSDKLQSSSLNVTTAAKKAGISFPSFNAALKGKSTPNARSINKYATFLGIPSADVLGLAGKTTETKGKTMKKAKIAKTGGKRRGRPPGSKNKVKGTSAKAHAGNGAAARQLGKSLKQAIAALAKISKGLRKLK